MTGVPDIPTELAPLTEWLQQQFGNWNVSDEARADLEIIFNGISHRGNKREAWLDALQVKVQKLREEGLTWADATWTALDTWSDRDPSVTDERFRQDFRKARPDLFLNLVSQLKNRKENVSDLGIDQVTQKHFWIALVAGRHAVAARLYCASKPELKTQIRNQLIEMASRNPR